MKMRNPWKVYREWDERRWRRHMKRWERKRAKGKERYTWWVAAVWGGSLILFSTLWDFFSEDRFDVVTLVIKIPFYLAGGYLLGLYAWSSNEGRYRKYIVEESKKSLAQH
jgi:hypothetical protein